MGNFKVKNGLDIGNVAATGTINPALITTTRTYNLPDVNGTLITSGDTGTVTSTMIADGTILNTDISATAAIADTKLATISTSGKVSNSATTATNLNTINTIVSRDASGNFSAAAITVNTADIADYSQKVATTEFVKDVAITKTSLTSVITDNAIVRWDGASGDVQNSGVIIDDLGNTIIKSPTPHTGDLYLVIDATNLTGGDSEAILVIDSPTGGESTIQFRQNNVNKGLLELYEYATGKWKMSLWGSHDIFEVANGLNIAKTNVTDGSLVENGNVFSGTYLPVVTNITNISTISASNSHYMRVGNTVSVGGRIRIDPSIAAAGTVTFSISLPVASVLTDGCVAGGFSTTRAGFSENGAISVDTTKSVSLAIGQLYTTDIANTYYVFNFTYQIL